jgi:hypothetical protein
MPVPPVAHSTVDHLHRSSGARRSTSGSKKPLLVREIKNVSSRDESWGTGTKVALCLTGAVIATGTVLTAVGAGNPVGGLVALGGLAAGIFRDKTPFSAVTGQETLPVPGELGGERSSTISQIDTCHRLSALMSGMGGQKIADISLSSLQSVKKEIEKVSVMDLNALTPRQLSEVGRCFGTNLMEGKVLPLKSRLEDARQEIMSEGDPTYRLFHPLEVARRNLLLAELDPKLGVVKEMHENIRSFVIQINERMLAARV